MAEIRTKPPCSRDDAEFVLRQLRAAGHIAYFAGGCVRDTLLGHPAKDWDIATDAPPKRVRSLFPRTQAVGQAFGVILVRHNHSVVEVATFRAEGAYLDGRRPSNVHFTTAQQDAQRRDFTINGLFLDPLDNDRVIDYVGGLEDLRANRLRAIGNPAERFREDHLRLLRAIRFAARFDLEIDSATADAIHADAPLLKQISPERVADELRLMLTPSTRNAAWELLWRFGLIHVICRFLPGEKPSKFTPGGSIFFALPRDPSIAFGFALAAGCLCYRLQSMRADADILPLLGRKPIQQAVHAMRQALKISNDESDAMRGAIEGLAPLLAGAPPSIAALKRFLARPTSSDSRRLLAALSQLGFHAERIAMVQLDLQRLERTDFAPPPLLTGDDLTAAGFAPGPMFRTILETVYDAQLEDRIQSREDALRLAETFRPPPTAGCPAT